MNERLKYCMKLLKEPKILVVIGILGIALIGLSSLVSNGDEESKKNGKQDFSVEEYKISLQEDIGRLVKSISGDSGSTVVITLESGVRYTYADTNEEDASSSTGKNVEESSSSSAKSYITVKNSDGGEQPLVITESMPEVRGVAIVCVGGDNAEINEKITDAVTAALNISSKKVNVSGGNGHEKR